MNLRPIQILKSYNIILSISATKKKTGSGFSIFGKKKVVAKDKKVVGGTHTLHTTGVFGVSKKKNVEYFGGDSTVTQAG